MSRSTRYAFALAIAALGAGCDGGVRPGGDGTYVQAFYPTLAEYGMVSLRDGQIVPNDGVMPYDLNTPLFSDSAVKVRTAWVPPGSKATYRETGAIDFPV